MDERDLRGLIDRVKRGRLSRRAFVQRMAAVGLTATVGSRANRMIAKPIIAFQNPTTSEGKTAAKGTRSAACWNDELSGEHASPPSHSNAAMVTPKRVPNNSRRLRSKASPAVASSGPPNARMPLSRMRFGSVRDIPGRVYSVE